MFEFTAELTFLNIDCAALPTVLFFIAEPMSLNPFFADFAALSKFSFADFLILENVSFAFPQSFLAPEDILSQFLYSATPAAIRPAISPTINTIGQSDIARFNAVCAAVIPPVVAVAAVVAAVCAAVAAVPAVSAAVPAVFATIFAITFFTVDTTFPPTSIPFCTPFTVAPTPLAIFPTMTVAGPIAAVTSPALIIVCCCP